jgi:catechol 1,2-dioxygenase
MQRRHFIKQTSAIAVGMGVFGNISWQTDKYIGDSITATDILGPFYRPGAPFRSNMNPVNYSGNELCLSGTIFNEDGKTPIRNCLIEVWQCQADGYYDNISDEYFYRASQKTQKDGRYKFITSIPVPEPVDEKNSVFRPAHIHMRLSVEGQQDLITQIYFQGDPYLESDPSTKSGLAINRTLQIQKIDEQKSEIRFDIVLKKEYIPDDIAFNRIAGIYKMSDGALMEFYRSGDLLFYKTNGQIWGGLSYNGDNTFGSKELDTEVRFELMENSGVNAWFRFSRRKEIQTTGMKILDYKTKI